MLYDPNAERSCLAPDFVGSSSLSDKIIATAQPEQAKLEYASTDVDGGENLFRGRFARARYCVGVLAVGDNILMSEAFTAARRLRFNKYHSLGWLPDSARDADGGEHDTDDSRSIQIGVIKNIARENRAEMIATSRLIIRGNEPLPVEKYFPEDYEKGMPVPDTEISRLVSSSRDKSERALATLACYRAMLGTGIDAGHRTTSAVVEDWLVRRIDSAGISYYKSAQYKEISDYADTRNTQIFIDSEDLVRGAGLTGSLPIVTKWFFRGIKGNNGIGYYGSKFLKRY